jgi:hypothetical protein
MQLRDSNTLQGQARTRAPIIPRSPPPEYEIPSMATRVGVDGAQGDRKPIHYLHETGVDQLKKFHDLQRSVLA